MPYTTTINHNKGAGQLDLFGAPTSAAPMVNADGSVKGATGAIYVPKGGTRALRDLDLQHDDH